MSTLTDDDLTALLTGVAEEYEVPAHGPDEVRAAMSSSPVEVPLLRRGWVQLAAASVAGIALVTGIALWGGGTSRQAETMVASGGGSNGALRAPAPMTAPGGVAAGGMTGGGGTTGGTTGGSAQRTSTYSLDSAMSAPVPAAAPQQVAVAPPAAAPGGATSAVGAPAPDGAEGRVVKTGSIALVTKDRQVSRVLSTVQQAARAHGGYVASSSSNEYGETPSGEVTLRVPVARFEDLVARIRSLDAEVRTATTSGKDVTAQYADIEAQLRTLRATRERFLDILGRTRTISEILSVQQRVDGVTGQIDRLEGSRKLLASQSELSTLTVSVSEEDDPVVRVAEERSGLAEAARDARNGFVTGIEAIVRHSGRAVLWLLCLGLAVAVARVAWKVARRRLV